MDQFIKITKLYSDELGFVELTFQVSNGNFMGTIEIFDDSSQFLRLAKLLNNFPFDSKDDFVWNCGSKLKCEFRLVHNSCIISITLDNKESGLDAAQSRFNISCSTIDFNKLGKLFQTFHDHKEEELLWQIKK